MAKTVDIQEAQSQLSELLSLASAGHEVIITEGDKPLAKLVPVAANPLTRFPGLNRGQIWVSEDFAELLPDEL